MFSLLRYMKEYKKEAILAPVFKMLEAFFELLIPFLLIQLFDVGIGEQNQRVIWLQIILMLIFALIGLISSITAQFYAAKAAVSFTAKIREILFDKLLHFSWFQIDRMGTSTLINRMSQDMNQIQSGVNMILRLFLRSPFVVFGSLVMVFILDRKAGFFFVALIILLGILVFMVLVVTLPLYGEVQNRLDHMVLLLKENLSGIRFIRSFVVKRQEIENYDAKADALYRLQKRAATFASFLNPGTILILNVFMVLLLYTGAFRIGEGTLSKGVLIALLNYMAQILGEFVKFANLMLIINKTAVSGRRVQELLSSEVEVEQPDHVFVQSEDGTKQIDKTAAVEYKHVNLIYGSNKEPSLKDINFSVKKGQFIGITGPTGSGKSSLLYLLAGFYTKTSGEIYVDGQKQSAYSLNQLRAKFGIVLQKTVLFQRSILDNLKMGKPECNTEEALLALEQAEALSFVKEKMDGIQELLYQGGNNLSGGQKQRLAIARALIKKPEILILDDCTSALDYQTEKRLWNTLKHLPFQPTIFMVSQRIQSMDQADLILVMDQGELVGYGTSTELLETCKVYQELYQSQKESQVNHEAI